ncbi:MAG: T9SS type A sorting domain-containing protein [Chitinophagales bacterium]|nr:T9SS type A sorting domain-containing protein [Chitinophagales bacterium]
MKQLLFLFLLFCGVTHAQQIFSLRLEPATLTSVPAVHSGAFGIYDSTWFFIGGRTNGLHGFQPPFAFPTSGINDKIYFVNPATDQRWEQDVYSLPDSIREPLTSSNMQFYLRDTMLYMVGGYGWKDTIQNFVTWNTLTAINLKGLKDAVISNQPIAPYFRQIADSVLAVCGAHLHKLDSVYYLVFGHRFDGYYDRSDTTGFHVQEYTHEIRKFQIEDDGTTLNIKNYAAVRDTANFRRRDYNLVPFLDPYKGEGLLAFSGVFQKHIDLPYLNCIEIFPDTVIVRNDFNQNLSQYHAAVGLIFDSVSFIQHNIFFGGMSMYYIDTLTGQTVTDSFVPFVQTISDVARDVDRNYHEINAGIRMPALQGTNAYFFPDLAAPKYRHHFVHLNQLPAQQRIGYLTSGIESPELNISFTDPSLSFAGQQVYEVYLDRVTGIATNAIINEVFNFYCYPNPVNGSAQIFFELAEPKQIKIEITDVSGKLLQVVTENVYAEGKHQLAVNVSTLPAGVYNCVLSAGKQRKAVRLIKR